MYNAQNAKPFGKLGDGRVCIQEIPVCVEDRFSSTMGGRCESILNITLVGRCRFDVSAFCGFGLLRA